MSGKAAGAFPHRTISLALYLFCAEVEPRVPYTVHLQPYCVLAALLSACRRAALLSAYNPAERL